MTPHSSSKKHPTASPTTDNHMAPGLAAGWLFIGLLGPLMVHLVRATENIFSAVIPFDAHHTYLPLARRLLDDPAAFFASPDSISVAPGIYLFMALCNADPELIRSVNIGLSLAVLLLLFDTAYRLAGAWAGTAAAWLYACSPVLKRHIFSPMSEAVFIFLVMLWLWLTVILLTTQPATTTHDCRHRFRIGLLALASGIALATATLTRGTYMYWIPTVAVLCLGIWLIGKPAFIGRTVARRLLASHLIALALVGGYMLKNQVDFDRPIIATGTGSALYYGNNPVIDGGEPPHYGLQYDDWIVVRTAEESTNHISIEGDRRLTAAAKLLLHDVPLPVLASMYWHKLGAILFFSKNELERHVLNNRAWRILLLVLSVSALWVYPRFAFVWLLAGVVAYQTTVHLPVLFNSRYSIGALDLPLTLLAAIGLRGVSQVRQRPYALATVCLLVLGGSLAGAYHQRHSRPLMPDLTKGPHTLMAQANPDKLRFAGLQGNPFERSATAVTQNPAITWSGAVLNPSGLSIVRLGVQHLDSDCRSVRFIFQADAGAQRSITLVLEGNSRTDDITMGLKDLVIPDTPLTGSLTAEFACDLGATFRLVEFSLYQASPALYYESLVKRRLASTSQHP